MFLRWVGVFLCLKCLEGSDDAETSVTWLDDIVDVAVFCSIVRICELVAVFLFFLCHEFGFLIRICDG